MKICDVKKVIYVPSNIFENTNIATCILYFEKKQDHKEVINNHNTSKIKFYNYQCSDEKLKLLGELTIEQIINNNYSLKYGNYFNDKKINYNNGCTVKKLNQLCKISIGKFITKESLCPGPYPVVGGGQNPLGYHNKYNIAENTIIISKDGAYAGYVSKYNTKVFLTSHGLYLDNINESINTEYLYYYLKLIQQEQLYKLQTGAAQPGLKKEYLEQVNIVYPNIDIQKNIVEELNLINDNYLNTIKMIDDNKKIMQIMIFVILDQLPYQEKKLGDVFTVDSGPYIQKSQMIDGEYDIYGGGDKSGKINKFNRENKLVIAKDGVSKECVRYVNGKFFLNHHGWTFEVIDKNLLEKFINYYLLAIQKDIYSLASGTAQKGISKDNFYNKLQIKVPSIENQELIINKMQTIERLIVQLEHQLTDSKNNMQLVINRYLKIDSKNYDDNSVIINYTECMFD
jgi:restriction endonuclease S subunit